MKLPFVSRFRHHAEIERLKNERRNAKELKKQIETKAARLAAKLELERSRTAQLEQLCEARLLEMNRLQSQVSELRRARSGLLDKLSTTMSALAPYTGRAIPTIIGIDVEPDARVTDPTGASWLSTSELFRRITGFRTFLSTTSGGAPVRFTWYPRADPQVEKSNGSVTWAFKHFKEEWDSLLSEGDEIGLHVHPWRWDDQAGEWYQDHADEAWVISCVRSSINAYRRALGKTPSSYRGGDRYLSNAVVRVLEEEGIHVDLTLERMPQVPRLVNSERGTGVIPDGTSIPARAFRPSAGDFRIADPEKTTGLGMLPLTSYAKGSLSPWLPNILFEQELDRILELAHVANSEAPTHLAFVIRSSLVHLPGWEDFVENTRSLARRVREGRLVFATASEAWSLATCSP